MKNTNIEVKIKALMCNAYLQENPRAGITKALAEVGLNFKTMKSNFEIEDGFIVVNFSDEEMKIIEFAKNYFNEPIPAIQPQQTKAKTAALEAPKSAPKKELSKLVSIEEITPNHVKEEADLRSTLDFIAAQYQSEMTDEEVENFKSKVNKKVLAAIKNFSFETEADGERYKNIMGIF